MTRLVYFAWVRERIGKGEEDIDLPADVTTGAALLGYLKTLGDGYAHALEHESVIRIAINQEHVEHDEPIAGAREIALFPPMTGG
ncbi:molybdopterin converting factor subunit 1 [Shinella sp. AETb1-6]|jgi:molybdopterin synthase sulfur carrier subunit|uniref:Molybdopterin converting factor subunit 1 n=1 Tax=Shinella sumterensis TaxID=1967501 RepID=A0AA50CRE9_9HYPH|nr:MULTISPECIES: molybdopterin converting factor subunit 1 [Shinella]MCD1264216.1 molybdopterin converting factor subunit 1 [Shinella sumterensis]MXN51806.1 molybdopterin converting factor subunit 1 [Shinella sp. AETb1-6]TFE97688.1 molybdopterin converting factor subunit 1 [Shinella sumterensis]WLR99101.1 molybdopterin converting factor subunit 1 [Shinella sumterensis]WLS09001.1 molybdopterin converting factor subunit 1 [Shinella sumterensis]